MKDIRKVLLGAFLILAIAAGALSFWFVGMAAIDYSLDHTCQYQKVGDQWITKNFQTNSSNGIFMPVICKNNGAMDGTFDLIITFTNASFLRTTSQRYQIINDTSVKFTVTLRGGEKQVTNVDFSIDNDADSFTILLSLERNQSMLRVENAQKGEIAWHRVYRFLHYNWASNAQLYAPVLIA